MRLLLADSGGTGKTLFLPSNSGNFNVDPVIFDRLSDFEYTNLLSDLIVVNPGLNVDGLIRERDLRRAKMRLPRTVLVPGMSSKFGDWLHKAGEKISAAFKPTESTAPAQVQLPDGQIVTVQTPIKQDSPFMNVLKSVSKVFGFYNDPVPTNVQKTDYSPLLYLGAGLVAYKLLKSR